MIFIYYRKINDEISKSHGQSDTLLILWVRLHTIGLWLNLFSTM